MQEHNSKSEVVEGISLIGFRLSPDSESPDLFTLIAYGDRDVPLEIDGEIIFFKSPTLASMAYELWPEEIKRRIPPPTSVDLICDVARTLHIIDRQSCDESATVLNCLNTLFDLVAATHLAWPNSYKGPIHNLADHLTFEPEFATFLNKQYLERETIVNALLWCIGAIVIKAKLIS